MKKDLSQSKTALHDSDGVLIDPATEPKQDTLISQSFTSMQALLAIEADVDSLKINQTGGAQTTRINDVNGTNVTGLVTASPASNTLLGRLKDIWDRLSNKSQITQLADGNGNIISSLGNALDIHNADVHIVLVNRHFIDFDTATEAISSVSAGDKVLLVASTAGFAVDDHVVLKDSGGDIREHHFVITALTLDTSVTLDTPVAIAYATGTMELVVINMAVDGSGTTQIFEVGPPSDKVWHIARLLISLTDGSDMDDGQFGGLALALTNGVVVRENKNSGTFNTLTNWKINGHMVEDMYDLTYVDRTLPAGSFGLRGRWTFKNADVISKLDGSTGDKLEILIQDDLTDLLTFRIKAQGHLEGV